MSVFSSASAKVCSVDTASIVLEHIAGSSKTLANGRESNCRLHVHVFGYTHVSTMWK